MTELSPRALALRYRKSDLIRQFVLSRSGAHAPEGWLLHRQDGWVLAVHPELPVLPMHAQNGRGIGWILGYPIDASGRLATENIAVPVSPDSGDVGATFESFLYRYGGRFLAILLAPRLTRVYLDPTGSLSAVYAPSHEMLAATPVLVPYERGCEDDADLIRTVGIPHRDGLLPFGLTPRRGVHRLLPNHFLDLSSWRAERHWPVGGIDDGQDPAGAVRIVASVLKRTVAAAAERPPVYAGITAGLDSRTLLACSRAHLDRIKFFTLAHPDGYGRRDCTVASHLARRHGFEHFVLPLIEASEEDLLGWLYRSGFAIGEVRGWHAVRAYAQLDGHGAELVALAGELSNGAYWIEGGRGREELTPERLLQTMHVPAAPQIVAGAQQWLRDLPVRRPMHILDLLYLEQRLGCWGGVFPYGDATLKTFRLYPFCHRDALTAMMRLPDAYKEARQFPRDLIAAEWPELLGTPFNRELGMRHYIGRAKRWVWLARRAVRERPSARA